MTGMLKVLAAGPGVTLQDAGRPGFLAQGLSRGGAADRLALAEGAALLGQDPGMTALEMAGTGGRFRATGDLRIALTGAPMRADVDGVAIAWNASHRLEAGAELAIGPAVAGIYGYLHVGGGFETRMRLGAGSAHLAAGIGGPVAKGDALATGRDAAAGPVGMCLPTDDRFSGGVLDIVPSFQTDAFPPDDIARFSRTRFTRDRRGNRMGVRLMPEGPPFGGVAGLTILSDTVVPGDVQIPGDGVPLVLLSECQTTGGYPRMGTVRPGALARAAQAAPGARLSFRFLTLDQAVAAERADAQRLRSLAGQVRPLVRDPADIADLLTLQLISGVTSGQG